MDSLVLPGLYYTIAKYVIRFQIKYHPFRKLQGSSWYDKWIQSNEQYDRETAREECTRFDYQPLLSIILPVYNVQEEYLRECIESVRRQYYTNWELCIADDHSTMPHIQKVLEEYKQLDDRIHVTYRSRNGHISECSNTALSMASGEYIVLLDNDDALADFALYEVVKTLNRHRDTDLLFSDEDKWLDGKRVQPFFKKEWGLPLLFAMNYICHLAVYRTALVQSIGGFRPNYEGVQDWDLAIRAVQKGARMRHVPKVLYHWRISPTSTAGGESQKSYIKDKQRMLLQDHKN